MQEQEETSFEENILAWLRSRSGDVVVVSQIAKKFKVGQAGMFSMLQEMEKSGRVRRSNAKRATGFYIPSQAQLNAEQRALEVAKVDRPLKIDKHRTELYAQLAAARGAIKSIG